MLECRVVQHVAAQHKGPFSVFLVTVPLQPLHVIPLLADGQDIQNGHTVQIVLCRRVLGQFCVQLKIIQRPQSEHGDGIFVIWTPCPFVLVVVVNGKEWEADDLEQQLQVAPAHAHDEAAVFACWTFQGQSDIACAQHRICGPLVTPWVFESEFHHTAQCIPSGRWKGPCIEVHPLHEVHVDHAHWPSTGTLCGKVIDVGDFNAVEVEPVFIGRTSADDNVVSKTWNGRHPRQGPKCPTDVAPPTRVALDFVGANASDTQGRLCQGGPRFHSNLCCFHGHRCLRHGGIHHRRARRGGFDFKCHKVVVAQKGDQNVVHTGGDAFQPEFPFHVGRCS